MAPFASYLGTVIYLYNLLTSSPLFIGHTTQPQRRKGKEIGTFYGAKIVGRESKGRSKN